jgi:hypothetical protein
MTGSLTISLTLVEFTELAASLFCFHKTFPSDWILFMLQAVLTNVKHQLVEQRIVPFCFTLISHQ